MPIVPDGLDLHPCHDEHVMSWRLRWLRRDLKLRFVDASEVRYARSGEVSVVYGVWGDGSGERRLYAVADS